MHRQSSSRLSGILALICLSLVLFLLAGCGGGGTPGPGPTPFPSATPTPVPSPSPTPTPGPTGPPPTIVQMTPGSAVAGGGAFTMTVGGTNFVSGSVLQFNGSPRTTTFVSSTQLQASVTAADIANVTMAHITVQNPQANGGISAASTFLVGSTGGPGFAIAVINQQAQRLLYDPRRQVIYAAVPSGATTNPNTNSVLDINKLAITSSHPTGVNPND